MKIAVNSDEFKAWHEVGHATACLHLGGNLESIEFLQTDFRGFAVAHCYDVMPHMERSVACGGFAAEYYLLNEGYVDWIDRQTISDILFSNAWRDIQEFVGRTVSADNDFTKEEKEAFMFYAIERVTPIFNQYFLGMQNVVKILLEERKIDGIRVKELLQLGLQK